MRKHPAAPAVLFALWLLAPAAVAETVSLAEIPPLDLDPAAVSVSGISSGAFMAVQFHVAHAANVVGAGVVAGGPYRCSEGSDLFAGIYAATTVCSSTNLMGVFFGPPDAAFSQEATREAAELGQIDDPAHLSDDRVWLLSGAEDKDVPTAVMRVLEDYYRALVDEANVVLEEREGTGHAMITEEFGNECHTSESPYINKCGFDAAKHLLGHIYDPLAQSADPSQLAPIITFDQTAFFDASDPSVSMNDVGHLYVPATCSKGTTCRLHIAFHGCEQYEEVVGEAYYANAGYNRWAESNDIVVLYPPTTAWGGSVIFEWYKNPKGCWDWWGYSGEDYYGKSGKQIRAVSAMVNALMGGPVLDTPSE